MESLGRRLLIIIALHVVCLLSYTVSAQPQILDIVQYAIHNHTEMPEQHKNCDDICKALRDMEVESNIVKLSSTVLYTTAPTTYQWQLLNIYEIIFTMMHMNYLRSPVPM